MPTALVIGANRGIGLALCRELNSRGFELIGACRHSSPDLADLRVRVESDVDVRDRSSLHRLAERLGDTPIALLVVVAGVLGVEQLGELDDNAFERIRLQFEVNAVGPLACVDALAGRLADGATIGLITSRMGSIEDNSSGGYYGYRMSKAALNAAGRSLAHDLRPRGISVLLLHPGFVQTDMTGQRGDVHPEQAAAQLADRLLAASIDDSGKFWHANGQTLPW